MKTTKEIIEIYLKDKNLSISWLENLPDLNKFVTEVMIQFGKECLNEAVNCAEVIEELSNPYDYESGRPALVENSILEIKERLK